MKRKLLLLALVLMMVLLLPVLVRGLKNSEERRFEMTTLDEASFQEVHFRNEEQDLDLAGVLFQPKGTDRMPGVVIIPGSGSSHRGNGWYLTLAEYLQRHGILVLLPDKRGCGASEGEWRTSSLEDLATDTLAALVFLRERYEGELSALGVVGMSQGGQVAPIAASRSGEIDFLINVVGGAVPLRDSLVYEETHNLMELGVLPGLAHLLAYPAAWSIIHLRQSEFWDVVGEFDPLPYWRKIQVPALILYGEEDTNTPSRESAAILRSLEKPNLRVEIYEDSGHALESPPARGAGIFRKDALRDIVTFIEGVTAVHRGGASAPLSVPPGRS